ncbi:MAG: ketoacyl-ACP synthase III [Solirubrobacteraceae bacterium]|nr:ketoacyl-ACP synthase III [Solirubrobacteraceae bacterium]
MGGDNGNAAALARPALRPRPRERRGVRLVGVGGYLPETVLTNEVLGEQLGVDAHWIHKRTLIEERRYANGMSTAEMATRAGRQVLENTGIDPKDIDLVIVAGDTPDDYLPPTAPLVVRELGCDNAGAFDLHAACTGWLYGLDVGSGMIESRRADTILLIGCQVISPYLDPTDKMTVPVMADGAGAGIITAVEGDGYVQTVVRGADASYAHLVRAGKDRIFRMEGMETFKQAIDALVDTSKEVVEMCGITIDDIDLFCYHQANGRILRRVVRSLDLPEEKVIEAIRLTGNTGPASIPLALERAQAEGRLESGQRILLGTVGAGALWASTLIEWTG